MRLALGLSSVSRTRFVGRMSFRRRVVLSCALVLLLLVQSAPGLALPTAPAVRSPAGPAPRMATAPTAGPAGTGPAALAPVSPVAEPVHSLGLCLVEILPWCPPSMAPSYAIPVPQSGSSGSWVNLTPVPFPATYPSERQGANLVYSPDDHGSLLFGGSGPGGLLQDTWRYSNGAWSELIGGSACTTSTCPSPRTEAMMTYDTADHEAVLFGGFNQYGYPAGVLRDTWVFSSGAWRNITATAGTPPSARFDGSMVFDSGDNFVLLFGGSNSTGLPVGETWKFFGGTWTNLTASLPLAPEAREGAAIGNSPQGWVFLVGGLGATSLIQNDYLQSGGPYVAWWFHNGSWSPATTPVNPHLPQSLSFASDGYGPCGRVNAALGWSPKNHRFVLFGGFGVPGTTSSCGSSIFLFPLNDTYVYTGSLGSDFVEWYNDTTPGAPSARGIAGYTSDYSAGYFLVFGGSKGVGQGDLNDTWRYFQRVAVTFGGPLTMVPTETAFDEFLLKGVGGSGILNYSANTTSLKTGNSIGNCPGLTDGLPHPLPPTGYIPCVPGPSSYNIYRITVQVWDTLDPTDRAWANWTVTVDPPEALVLFSQYKGYFYEGFQVNNIFGVYAQIGNAPVTHLSGTIQGFALSFSHSNSSQLWWNSTPFDMGMIGPGAVLQVTASSSDWSENATLPVSIIATPDWMQQLGGLAGVIQSTSTSGQGAWNLSFSLTQQVTIPIGKIFNFSLPIPLVSGNYSLIPSLSMSFKETSSGAVTLSGTFTLSTPSISLGAFSLTISASVQVSGTFSTVAAGAGTSTIQWLSASVTITVKGDFKGSFPIYGFSFDFLGTTVHIGFTLDIEIAPSIAVELLMMPTSDSASEVLDGFGMTVAQILGSFSFPLTATVEFGIGIASVGIGGTLSVAANFEIAPGPFELANLWVNGSIFVTAQVFFWSGSWNLLGPGNIFHFVPAFLRPHPAAGPNGTVGYDNGTDAVWSVQTRYYNTTAYETVAWSPGATAGPAVTDLYPSASVTAAPAYDGAYLFYANDQVDRPVAQGLTVGGVRLDSATNGLSALPSPADPGFVLSAPQVTNLPDGSLYALWSALPLSESGAATPAGLTSVALHGARFYPSNQSWGPVRAWTSGGFAESYALDGPGDALTVLRAPRLIVSESTPEWLETYNLSSGALLSNASVAGIAAVDSVREAGGWAAVERLDGNVSVLGLATGAADALPTAPGTLVAAGFVAGSPSVVLLRYRAGNASALVLYDLGSRTAIATVPLDGSVSDAHAVYSAGLYYLLAATGSGLVGWEVAGTTLAALALPAVSGLDRFGLVQAGGALLVYSTVTTTPGAQPIKALELAEIPLALPAIQAGRPSPTPGGAASTGPGPNYLLYLGLVAAAVAVVLVLALVVSRRPRRPAPLSPAPPAGAGGAPPPGAT
jgi:hypothetical protein